MPKIDTDKLYMVSRDAAATVAHKALRPIQERSPHEMVAGVAILFATLCARVSLDPQEMHALGVKMLKDQECHFKTNDALQSLRDFAGLRIAGEKDVVVS